MSLSQLLVLLSLTLAALLVATTRTAWGRRKPLHRYAALSVAAHLLLVAGLASVRTGGPPATGAEDAPPVTIDLVLRSSDPQPAVEKPVLEEPVETPVVEPSVIESPSIPTATPGANESPNAASLDDTPPPSPALPSSATSVRPSPEELPLAESTPTDTAASLDVEPERIDGASPEEGPAATPLDQAFVTPIADPVTPSRDAGWESAREPVDSLTPTAEPVAAPIEDWGGAPVPAAPAAYADRGAQQRRRIALDAGGSQETLDAVASAVDWLARAQRPDGAWDSQAWGGGRETYALGEARDNAGKSAETGLTGLALLALGGAGHTHLDGPYRETVTRGLAYLVSQQAENGSLAGNATRYARTYCHSMATFALAEALAVSGDERLRPSVERAIAYLVRSQSRTTGGWRYHPGSPGDMSQMGWVIMALRSAELAGVAVPESAWAGCGRFLDSVSRGRFGGLACYQPRSPTSATMTAEAMYCRQILGIAGARPAAEQEALERLLAEPPTSPRRDRRRAGAANLYYWYYATLALHHHRATDAAAQSGWDRWNAAMKSALLKRQVGSGRLAGSWDPTTVWGGYGGRVYTTALAAMCLEVYYRYDPNTIGRDPWIAARPGRTIYR